MSGEVLVCVTGDVVSVPAWNTIENVMVAGVDVLDSRSVDKHPVSYCDHEDNPASVVRKCV